MIKTFRQRYLENCFRKGIYKRVPTNLLKRVVRLLDVMEAATSLKDLKAVPGNQLHRLKGDRRDELTIHVSGAWCLVFRYQDGNFYDVGLEQYH